MRMIDADLAIVGSGFGGSLLAMIATRLGFRVALLERGRHPRFAIGESASPLAGVLLEQLADRYQLPRVKPLAAYGPWRRTCPDVVCGLKRGFTYYKQVAGQRYRPAADRSNQLLVAASPSDEVSDTHWLRADVDHFLVREAVAMGVEYIDRLELSRLDWTPSGRPTLEGMRAGAPVRVRAGMVVDASGPRGFLARTLALDAPGFASYPRTQALFSHFSGVARCDAMPDYAGDQGEVPPYAPDDAALHHVFDDGWMWVLRFENGVTSAGVALTEEGAARFRLADGALAWQRLLAEYPSLQAQFADAVPTREFTWMPAVPYRAASAAGPGWAMLPSAAAFIDPLFSTGIPMTLLGIEQLARWLEVQGVTGQRPGSAGAYAEPANRYATSLLADADHVARFVGGCYAGFPRFPDFVAYAMCYFAAASFGEMSRRLGRRGVGFLANDDPALAAAIARLSPALGLQHDLAFRVAEAMAPINVAGLCNPAKRNWYGIDAADPIRGAGLLGASEHEVRAMLAASGVPESALNAAGAGR